MILSIILINETRPKPRYNAVVPLLKGGRRGRKLLEHSFNAESMIEANFGYGDSHREPDLRQETSSR